MQHLRRTLAAVALLAVLAPACSSPSERDPQPAAVAPAVTATGNLTAFEEKGKNVVVVAGPSYQTCPYASDGRLSACDIQKLYRRVLGREANANEVTTSLAAARTISDLVGVERGLALGPESRNNIDVLYRACLLRPASEAEIDAQVATLLQPGSPTLLNQAVNLVRSDEARAKGSPGIIRTQSSFGRTVDYK